MKQHADKHSNTDERDVPLLPDDELRREPRTSEVQDVNDQNKFNSERRDTFIQSVGCQTWFILFRSVRTSLVSVAWCVWTAGGWERELRGFKVRQKWRRVVMSSAWSYTELMKRFSEVTRRWRFSFHQPENDHRCSASNQHHRLLFLWWFRKKEWNVRHALRVWRINRWFETWSQWIFQSGRHTETRHYMCCCFKTKWRAASLSRLHHVTDGTTLSRELKSWTWLNF